MENFKCKYCGRQCIKNGFHSNGKQRLKCKSCGKRQMENYNYNAYNLQLNTNIIALTKEGLGIRSLSRYLKVSATTIMTRTLKIAESIVKPLVPIAKTHEVDELCTYIGKKSRRLWVCYGIEIKTRNVVDFRIGNRTNKTLKGVIETLVLSASQTIYTDGLKNYKSQIPQNIHKTTRFGTNHIERKNLSLRTHLKRLSRKTICYTKSILMLSAVLKIYFWG